MVDGDGRKGVSDGGSTKGVNDRKKIGNWWLRIEEEKD